MPINPIKRIRDGKRYFKPQDKISIEEWMQVVERAARAEQFFDEENYIYQIMKADLENKEALILSNAISEEKEVHVVTEVFTKIFTKPLKMQRDEIIGQIKYIRSYLSGLQACIDRKAELERDEARGVIFIERNNEARTI